MRAAGAKGAGGFRTIPAWAKILIGVHLFASVVWAMPRPPDPVVQEKVQPSGTLWLLYWNNRYLKPMDQVRAYILSLGAWQYWDMFAPDPARTDTYCTADITYRDGSTRTVGYPRMYDLPIPVKYVKERYRKFYERAHSVNPEGIRMFPMFAQAMALRGYADPKNPPLVVRLKAHTLDVAPPGQPQPERYHVEEYYAYAVDQAWLRRAAGGR